MNLILLQTTSLSGNSLYRVIAHVAPPNFTDNRAMDEQEQMRRWVAIGKQAGPELEAIRRREIQEADNRQVLESLESSFNYAVRLPPRPSSGMVEMQKYFAKIRAAHERPAQCDSRTAGFLRQARLEILRDRRTCGPAVG